MLSYARIFFAESRLLGAIVFTATLTVPLIGLFGLVAAAVSLVILTGVNGLFPTLSPLALPFNLAVMLTLYTLRLRLHPSLDLLPAPEPPGSPEENLSRYRENLRAWKRWGVTLSLPYQGTCVVSQGVGGTVTHQGDWRFAYDFQMVAADGALFCNSGVAVEDYYTWGGGGRFLQ